MAVCRSLHRVEEREARAAFDEAACQYRNAVLNGLVQQSLPASCAAHACANVASAWMRKSDPSAKFAHPCAAKRKAGPVRPSI